MEDCLFCKIIKGEIPSTKVYEDEFVYAFKDINPEAPVHILVVPKKHIESVNGPTVHTDKKKNIIGKIFLAIKKIAKEQGLAERGYRVVSNCGKDAGQTVMHLHFHILGGKELGEKVL